MQEILINILSVSYIGAGIVAITAYWPTIKDLYYGKPSANLSTYLLWMATTSIGVLYSIFILDDLLVRIAASANFSCCVLIFFLRLRIRNKP